MNRITDKDLFNIIQHLKYLGYREDCFQFVQLVEEDGLVKILDYPTSDHYNGIPETLLKILIRDLEEAVFICNQERG